MNQTTSDNLPRLASHRFTYEALGTYHGIGYDDVLNPNGTPKCGVEILGVNAQHPQEIMVRTAEGLEVFFHWRNK